MDELKFEMTEDIESYREEARQEKTSLYIVFGLPAIMLLYAVFGILETSILGKNSNLMINDAYASPVVRNFDKANILSGVDIAKALKDTVYTNKDNWLELRIDQQTLYQHWRDGRVEKYLVSTGNKHLDSKALESRPGLFAIFFRNAHHLSSQFDLADMYHYMPFNQGIGFHSINGTAYYEYLGKRPSSHGCIRLSHKDAEKLFEDCKIGTLVLAHNGETARTVGFAPEDYENAREYSEEEYKMLLSRNLYNILNGRYFMEEREFFVIDPKVIPVSGVYISYDKKIPKQVMPREYIVYNSRQDQTAAYVSNEDILGYNEDGFIELASNFSGNEETDGSLIKSDKDMIKKYFHNPIGILPYFPPVKKEVVAYTYTTANNPVPESNTLPEGTNNNENSDNENINN